MYFQFVALGIIVGTFAGLLLRKITYNRISSVENEYSVKIIKIKRKAQKQPKLNDTDDYILHDMMNPNDAYDIGDIKL